MLNLRRAGDQILGCMHARCMFLPTGQLLQPIQIPLTILPPTMSRPPPGSSSRMGGGEQDALENVVSLSFFVWVVQSISWLGGVDLKDSENSARGLGSNKGWEDRNTHSG